MNKKIIFAIGILVILLAIFFFPKNNGYSYGGFVRTGDVLHRERYNCFGIEYEKYGENPFSIEQCSDCGKNYFCAGIPYDKTCYEWIADGSKPDNEKVIPCK
ncbi:MAG: hypothetical protein WC584_05030 [Candidatus Pacearchaeota archaeon]